MSLPPLAERIALVRQRIEDACRRAGRGPDAVRLVAVSKTRPAADIEAAAALGVTDFGENRVQEALGKIPSVRAPITPHLVGHLQRNKARAAARLFSVIQSVDSLALARRLSAIAGEGVIPVGGGPLRVFAQVNFAGEASKSGFAEADLEPALEGMTGLSGLRLLGLMLIPPFEPDPEAARPAFARLRELAGRLANVGLLPAAPELSMGMSHDYPAAIAEGATTVRIGAAIFGPRAGAPVSRPASANPGSSGAAGPIGAPVSRPAPPNP